MTPSVAGEHQTLHRAADAVRVIYLAAAAVLTVVEPVPLVLIASLMVALAVRFIGLPGPFDLAVVVAMVVTGVSSGFAFYDSFGLYDRLVHFGVLALLAPPAVVALEQASVIPPLNSRNEVRSPTLTFVVMSVGIGLAIGAAWEVFEWSADKWAGLTLAHGSVDTIGDLVADGLGAAFGALVAMKLVPVSSTTPTREVSE